MKNNTPTKYVIQSDIKFKPLLKFNIPKLVDECIHDWFNQTLCKVNDSVVRLGILKGEFHWHKHDLEDEFFYVVEGQLLIDFEDKTVALNQSEGIMVPKGVKHRTRAPKKCVVLMVENDTIKPTGDK